MNKQTHQMDKKKTATLKHLRKLGAWAFTFHTYVSVDGRCNLPRNTLTRNQIQAEDTVNGALAATALGQGVLCFVGDVRSRYSGPGSLRACASPDCQHSTERERKPPLRGPSPLL